MTPFWRNPFLRSRYLLAIVAGLLLASAFPKIGIAGFAWIGPGLMVLAASGKTGIETFRIGFVAGLAYQLASLHWLLLIPYRWLGVPFGPALGWLALGAYLALYPAVWVWLVDRLRRASTAAISSGGKLNESHRPFNGLTASPETWIQRFLWCLGGAAVWVALEMIQARFLSGFPWNLLGASQYQMLPLIQIASVTGVSGISFVVVWISLALVSAAMLLIRNPGTRSVWVGEILLPVLVVAGMFHLGLRHLRQDAPEGGRILRVTMVQPSIPQTLIWDESNDDTRFSELLRLSDQAVTSQRTDLLIWPEAAVPKLFRYDRETFEAVTGLARKHKIWMIIGADDAEPKRTPGKEAGAYYYNSSFLINPEGNVLGEYRKRNLVIFGEYIPLLNWLPFLKFFTPIEGGFTPGDRAGAFELPDLGATASLLICFEDVFPTLARNSVGPDTDFLVNLTNNGWFGESAAQWQHAASAVFRAVENRLPLIRSANNGLTCWVDANGQIREILRDTTGGVYGPGALTIEVPLTHGSDVSSTFYNRNGDWFGWGCTALAVIFLVQQFRRAR